MTTFASPRDVVQRLENTICLYKNEPVVVKCTPDSWDIRLRPPGARASAKDVTINVQNGLPEDFDFSAPPLGYIDTGSAASYLKMSTRRQYSGGVSIHSVVSSNIDMAFTHDILFSKAMARCILGEHMPFTRALELVQKGERTSAAFSRHFALKLENGSVFLHHRDLKVGVVNQMTKKVSIFDSPFSSVIMSELRRSGFSSLLE